MAVVIRLGMQLETMLIVSTYLSRFAQSLQPWAVYMGFPLIVGQNHKRTFYPTLGHASSDCDLDKALIIKSATPLRQRIKVSSNLERICMKTLEKEAGDRFSTAGDLSRALRKFILVNRVRQARPLMSLSAILLACTLVALQPFDFFLSAKPAAVAPPPAPKHAASTAQVKSQAEANDAELPPRTLESLLAKGAYNLSTDDAHLAAKLIIAELRVNPNEHHPYWQYFASSDENTLQTELFHSCAAESLNAMSLIAPINSETNISIRSAMFRNRYGIQINVQPRIAR